MNTAVRGNTDLGKGSFVGNFVDGIPTPFFWDSGRTIDLYLDHEGSGTPENIVVASRGSVWRRRDGTAATTAYLKTAGDNNATGWKAVQVAP
jgi:hypothetical protein